ncbi:MAG TPA: BON domain-containing protein [Bacteroidota bacterium]|nr:BON domain-containing protein [Bacteroidota bacterium]
MRSKLQLCIIAAALGTLGFTASAQNAPRDKTMQSDSMRGLYNNDVKQDMDLKKKHGSDTTHSRMKMKSHMKHDMDHDTTGARHAPDNTGRNKRDRYDENLTPTDQSNKPEDLELTRKIRAEIIDQEGMSVNARNIKIITVNGRVTLRGPVNSVDEKDRIAEIAGKFATAGHVDNQLEVKNNTDQK